MQISAATATLVLLIVLNNGRTMPLVNKSEFLAIYSFGDSILDTGNNAYMSKPFDKCIQPPYGQDFPDGHIPTGRCSNGKLVTDFIASDLKIKDYVTPFLDPKLTYHGHKHAVNFGFGGTGYDERTAVLTGTTSIPRQLDYFEKYIAKLKMIQGEEEAQRIISRSLVLINGGNNDMAINFYDIPTRRLQFKLSEYQNFLLSDLRELLTGLYGLGVRKMAVAGLLPLGCLPIQKTLRLRIKDEDRKCIEEQNSDSEKFNNKLRNLLSTLVNQWPDSKIVYFDMYGVVKDMVDRPQHYGFLEENRGCCGTGLVEIASLCNPITPPCPNASQFVFWDAAHPSQTTHRYLANYFYHNVLPQLL